MDPVSGWTIVKNVADAAKKLYEIGKSVKDQEIKHRVDEVADELRDLKQQASELEDENRTLKERLRFKSDDFEFKNPFHYEKKYPETPLCAKCYSKDVKGPMSEPHHRTGSRTCLVCGNLVRPNKEEPDRNSGPRGPVSAWS